MTTLKPQRRATAAPPERATTRPGAKAAGSRGGGQHLLRRMLPVLIVLVALAAVYLVRFSSVLAISDVQVRGVNGAQAAAVRARVQVPTGTPLAAVDLAGVGARIAGVPLVDRVDVERGWPHTLVLTVHPRRAVLTVANSEGQLQVVDRYGYAFAAADAPTAGAPLVTLRRTPIGGRQAALVVAYQVISTLTPAHRAAVSKVTVTGAQSVTFRIDGVRVTWGDGSQSALKNTVLTALIKDAKGKGGHHKMNLSTPQAPTVG